jgi:predicted aspartyl protease
MQLTLRDNLPFTTIKITNQGRQIEVSDVLVDTGSAGTVFDADIVARVGIIPEAQDVLHAIRGVGGTEVVFTRQVDSLQVGPQSIEQFEIEVGGLGYGIEIKGILGTDFLIRAGAIIDLHTLEIQF